MYTDEDLSKAVNAGIFDETAVKRFRDYIADQANTAAVDEENFRLVSGFNDIFVSISALVLMMSAGWVAGQANPIFGALVVAILAWLLSIFFVKKRRLALPAIVLLIFLVASVVTCLMMLLLMLKVDDEIAWIASYAGGALIAWLHWRHFHVPITVAAGIGSAIVCVYLVVQSLVTTDLGVDAFVFFSGLVTFTFAMRWDAKDIQRTSRQSDVAFWLHLLSAPLIVHPVFLWFGILKGESGLLGIVAVILMYVFFALISIAVDRRALMVSSLVYVLYAFNELFSTYGVLSSSLALSGLFIGSFLLLLSAFWHKSRAFVLSKLPHPCLKYLP